MIVYQKTLAEFWRDAPQIADVVWSAMHPNLPVETARSSEYDSWRNSVGGAMSHVLRSSDLPETTGIAIEYRINGSAKRIDFLVSGYDGAGRPTLHIVELKQWDDVRPSETDDMVITYVGGGEGEYLHPSLQASGYAYLIRDFYQLAEDAHIRIDASAYLHNLRSDAVVRSPRYHDAISEASVFVMGEHENLARALRESINDGDSGNVLSMLDASPLTPSKRLIDHFAKALTSNDFFRLVDDQRVAYQRILHAVRSVARGEKSCFIVRGGPGTGKSVIAVSLLSALMKQGYNARFATKNSAPRTILKNRLRKGGEGRRFDELFVSTDVFFEIPAGELDAVIVDEAHRMTEKSGVYRNLGDNQIRDVLRASRVTIFLVDDNQAVTWRDIGTTATIRDEAEKMGIPVHLEELTSQFRCAGSDEYLTWVDRLLAIEDGNPRDLLTWSGYDVGVAHSASNLFEWSDGWNSQGKVARVLAGYCWNWVSQKDAAADDIVLENGQFRRKWNLRRDGLGWLDAPGSEDYVGCIHTMQGLEADYVAVLFGRDLVIRDGRVVTNPLERAKTDQSLRGWKSALQGDPSGTREKTDALIKNTYRTLLTRGMRGTLLYSVDPETNAYFREVVESSRSGRTIPHAS